MTGSVKLTERQRALLELAADAAFRIQGLSVYGPREFRTAQSLDRRELARLDVFDKLYITPAGRSLINQESGQ